MTARRTTRKAATADVTVTEDPIAVFDAIVASPEAVAVLNTPVETPPAPKARKYMSHEGCDHARKGEAGKAARQVCRRNHRAWFAAEAEWLASQESDAVAV